MPNTFIRKKPQITSKWARMTPEQQAEFEKYRHTILGDDYEESAFSNFARLFRENIRYKKLRIFSMNGTEFLFPDAEMKAEITGEYDQVIVVEAAKVVVYAEYKGTFSGNHARKKRQFERFREHLTNHFPAGEGWKLVTSYGFGKWPEPQDGGVGKRPCRRCEKFTFLVGDYQGIKDWFDNIMGECILMWRSEEYTHARLLCPLIQERCMVPHANEPLNLLVF